MGAINFTHKNYPEIIKLNCSLQQWKQISVNNVYAGMCLSILIQVQKEFEGEKHSRKYVCLSHVYYAVTLIIYSKTARAGLNKAHYFF